MNASSESGEWATVIVRCAGLVSGTAGILEFPGGGFAIDEGRLSKHALVHHSPFVVGSSPLINTF